MLLFLAHSAIFVIIPTKNKLYPRYLSYFRGNETEMTLKLFHFINFSAINKVTDILAILLIML